MWQISQYSSNNASGSAADCVSWDGRGENGAPVCAEAAATGKTTKTADRNALCIKLSRRIGC